MIDVFSRCHAMIDEKKLEERLVALEAAKSWSPRVVSRLEMLLRSGTDEALYRINPIQFATEKSIAEAEGIDLFLHACVAGLFDMDWLLVCPMCSDVVESFRNLRKLHTHFHCHLCQSDYEAALDDYITVTFTVSPAVRGIRFHKPDALSAWDYLFHYKLTPGGIMPDGVPWSEGAKGLVRALTRIEPGSTANLEVDAAEGGLMGQDFESDAQFFFPVASGAGVTPPHVPVMLDGGKCVAASGKHRTRQDRVRSSQRRQAAGGIRHPAASGGGVSAPEASLHAMLIRQATADDTNLSRLLPLGGDRRHGGHCGSRRYPRIHRSQGLDGALRADRRP